MNKETTTVPVKTDFPKLKSPFQNEVKGPQNISAAFSKTTSRTLVTS